jgi:beta-glucosidase
MGWFIDEKSEPRFPLGFGLSYTTFEYSKLQIAPARGNATSGVTISAQITNTGSRAGEEIVQLYIQDVVCSFATPVRRLVAFRRLTVQPGQTQTVEFRLDRAAFAALDQSLQPRIEPGEFKISLARSFSDDAMTGRITLEG